MTETLNSSKTSSKAPAKTSHASAAPGTSARNARTGLVWWQAIALGAIGSSVVNLIVLLVGGWLGASYRYVDAGQTLPITAGGVLFSSTVPLLLGTLLAVALARWRPVFLRIAQVVGGGFAVLSVAGPLMLDTDGTTRSVLAVMHVVAGVAVVAVLEAVRRNTINA